MTSYALSAEPHRAHPRAGATILAPMVIYLVLFDVFFMIMWPRYAYMSIGGPRMTLYFLATVVTVGALGAGLVIDDEFRARFLENVLRARLAVGVVVTFYLWRFVCDFMGDQSFSAIMNTITDLRDVATAFFIGLMVASDRRAVGTVIRLLALLTIAACGLGLFEFATKQPLIYRFNFGIDGADASSQLSYLMFATVRDGTFRARSVFNHPIVFGQFCACMAPLMVTMLRTERALLYRLVALAALAIVPVGCYVTNTRSAILGLGVSLVTYLVLDGLVSARKGGKGIFIMAGLLVLVAVGGLLMADTIESFVTGRTTAEASSSATRNIMFSRAGLALDRSPIVGHGDGMSPVLAGVIGPLDYVTIDNYYISIAVDFGFVGLLLFLAVIGVVAATGILKILSNRYDRWASLTCQAYVAGIVAIAASMYIVSIYDAMSFFYLFAGMLCAQAPNLRPMGVPAGATARPVVLARPG